MYVVQASDLREETGESFVVVFPVVYCSGPVVAPLDHGSGFQRVRTDLVNVARVPFLDLRPVTERQQVLQVPGAHHFTLLHQEVFEILKLATTISSVKIGNTDVF